MPRDFEDEFDGASALATECFMNFGMVAGTVQAAFARLLASRGVPSLGAFNVLTILEGEGAALPPSVIASRMVVSRPTITGLLDTLEHRGLVRRVAHESDGRMLLAELSTVGRASVRRLLPLVHAFEKDVVDGLDRAQQRDLLGLLAILEQHLGAIAPDVAMGIRD